MDAKRSVVGETVSFLPSVTGTVSSNERSARMVS